MSDISKWLQLSTGLIGSKYFAPSFPFDFSILRIYRYIYLYSKKPKRFNYASNNNRHFKHQPPSLASNYKQLSTSCLRVASSQTSRTASIVARYNKVLDSAPDIISLTRNSFLRYYIYNHSSNTTFTPSRVRFILIDISCLILFLLCLPFLLYHIFSTNLFLPIAKQCLAESYSFIHKFLFFRYFYYCNPYTTASFFFSAYGNESEIYALHRVNTLVLEFLHSHVHVDHFGYNLYSSAHNKPNCSQLIEPDVIVGPQQYKKFFSPAKLYVDEVPIPISTKLETNRTYSFLLIGQADSTEKLLEFTKNNTSLLGSSPAYHLHPREDIPPEILLSVNPNFTIIVDKPVTSSIVRSKAVCSALSSVLVDLISLPIPLYILSTREYTMRYLGVSEVPDHIIFLQECSN